MMGSMNQLRARLFRDWIGLRTWVWTCALAAWIGPLVNLVNAWSSNRPTGKATSLLATLYNEDWSSFVTISHGTLMSMGHRPPIPLAIHGLPTCSLWMMASALFVSSAIGAFDTEGTVYQSFAEPVSRRVWLIEKFLFALLAVTGIAVIRCAILYMTWTASPHVVPFVTIVDSFCVTWATSVAVSVVTLFAAMLVQSVVIVSMVSFIFLSLPLGVGAIVGSYSNVQSIVGPKMYWLEHAIIMPLSPFFYGHYNVNIVWGNSQTIQVVETGLQYLWIIIVGVIVLAAIAFIAALRLASESDGFSFSSLCRSRRTSHALSIIGGILFGSVAAQIIMAGERIIWLPMSVIGYLVFLLLFRLEHLVQGKVERIRRG